MGASVSRSSSSQVITGEKLEKEEESRRVANAKAQQRDRPQSSGEKPQGSGQKKQKPPKTAGVSSYPSTPQQAAMQKAYQAQAMFHMHAMMCAQQQLMMIQQSQAATAHMKAMAYAQAMCNVHPDMQEQGDVGEDDIQEVEQESSASMSGLHLDESSASTGCDHNDTLAESQSEGTIEEQIARAVEAARMRNPENQLKAQIQKVMEAAQERNGATPVHNGKDKTEKQEKRPPSLEDEIARVMESARERTGKKVMESI